MSGLQTNAAARADRQASAAGEAWSRSISAARSLGPEVMKACEYKVCFFKEGFSVFFVRSAGSTAVG